MKFVINGDWWEIGFKNSNELKKIYETQYNEEAYFCFGLTVRSQNRIWINEDMVEEQQIRTLKHELTHCYIWEMGLYNVPSFNEEMACDLVSRINDFINKIVEEFKENYLGKYAIKGEKGVQ